MASKWLLGLAGGGGFQPDGETFPPLHVNVIGRNLKLEKRGERDAKAGIPKPDEESLSQAEHEVVERVGELRRKGLEHYELQIGTYASRIRGARAARDGVEVEAGQFATTFEIESRACANHLDNAMGLVKGSYEKLEAYRKRHGTVGPPDDKKNNFIMIRRFHSEVQHQPARGEARAAAVPSPGGVASLPGRCKPCRALSAARRTQGGRSPTGGRRAADSAHLPSEPPPAAPEGPLRAAAPGGRPRTG